MRNVCMFGTSKCSNASPNPAPSRFRASSATRANVFESQFSQLVAVGPFAMLGVVMMASVARVCRISGITAVYEEIASGDVQGVLSASDELALADEFGSVADGEEGWDEGVLVEREE